jgi:hypothetical protein
MQKLMRRSAVTAVVAALAVAPTAMAFGGAGSGGGGGGTARPVATGGGGGGGGGVNKGGVKDTGTTAAPACATITSVGAPVGYFSTFAALWNEYSVKSCGTGTQNLTMTITNTNRLTGAVEFSYVAPVILTAGQNSSGMVDNDFAPFSTDYDVSFDLRDGKGTPLDTQTIQATTPAQK